MTRDETVALFLECEAKRAEARAAALAESKSGDDAENIAHEAAKAHWNAWAEGLLAERRALEEAGAWKASRHFIPWYPEQGENKQTRAWLEEAAEGEANEESGSPKERVKLIRIKDGLVRFGGFIFPGEARFRSAAFSSPARFDRAAFSGLALFSNAAFSGYTRFNSAAFSGPALFGGQTFTNDVFFNGAAFQAEADFALATFERVAQFNGACFLGPADFNAVWGKRTFSLSAASFEGVPDFIQAHFEEAPRLDNVQVVGRMIAPHPRPGCKETESRWIKLWREARYAGGRAWTWPRRAKVGISWRVLAADRDIPARWLALKRLAIQAHDTDRELEFHARQERSARFAGDWPAPWPVWRGKAWGGFFRFWSGILYQVASDFGRSLARPLAFWVLAVVLGAVVYVSQSPAMVEARAKARAEGHSALVATLGTAFGAWWSEPVPCYGGDKDKPQGNNPPPYVGALSKSLQTGTDLANEAWHLAFRNAFILLDGSSEAAHRTYGCLYGVELYGGSNPLAILPSAVSTASAIQKLFSALMIFLFGLALRNMLKVK
ncbi:MAG: pentapeptide repeat-containing protein [Rhodomicrobium sp.]|nr:pentapeptide repeat-containing protein [Rhodomicrobium sp.]